MVGRGRQRPRNLDGKLRLNRQLLRVSPTDNTPRAIMPGLWRVPHSGLITHPTLKARDTIDGAGVLAGRRLMLLWTGPGSRAGGVFMDITGPWR